MAAEFPDDRSYIEDMKKQIEEILFRLSRPKIISSTNFGSPRVGIESGKTGINFPIQQPIKDYGTIGNLTVAVFLRNFDSHVAKMTLNGDISFAFNDPPPADKMMTFVLDIKQDGVGGHNVISWGGITPVPELDTTPNARTILLIQTTDGGATYNLISGITAGADVSEWSTFPAISNVDIANFLLSNVSNLGIVDSAGNPRAQLFGNDSPTNQTTLDLVTDHKFAISETLSIKLLLDFLANTFTINDLVFTVIENTGLNAIQLLPQNAGNDQLRSTKTLDILIGGVEKLRLNTLGDIIMLGVVANLDVNSNFITNTSELDIIDFVTLVACGQIYGDVLSAIPTLVVESGSATANIRMGNLGLTKYVEWDHTANSFVINNLFLNVIESTGLNAIQFLASNVINNQMRTTKNLEVLRAGVNIFTILTTGIDLLGVSSLLNIDDAIFADSALDPSINGQFRLFGTDMKVFSGGQVRNLSNIVGGQTSILTHKFTVPETWNAITGLSAETITQVMINALEITGGLLTVVIDGLIKETIAAATKTFNLYGPVASVVIESSHVGSYDVTTATFVRILGDDGWVHFDMFFKPDGTKMYVSEGLFTDYKIKEYDLSTPWNISTAVLLQEKIIGGAEQGIAGIFFRHDGKKLYYLTDVIAGGGIHNEVSEYNLTTAWNITTASFIGRFDPQPQDTEPRDMFFKPDGTKMYVMGGTNSTVYEYNLSTPWAVTTSVFFQSKAVAANQGLHFRADGLRMYVSSGTTVTQYTLTTAWDISTAVAAGSKDVSGQSAEINGVYIKPDGTEMYVVGENEGAVIEYNLNIISSFPGTGGLQAYAMVIRG